MRHKIQQSGAYGLALALMLCMAATVAPAQRSKTKNIDKGKLHEATEESSKAAKVFREIMRVPEKAIPRELLDKAEAVAVFPNVVKAAFIFGGRGGDGVISRRTTTGWSAPAFFNIGGASFGVQIGAQSTDYVLLFMNDDALKGLLEDKFEFGGEASVAAGPVGRTAAAITNLTLDAGILSYSRSKGAFIGTSIQGAVVNPDNDLNEAIYGGMKARDILTGERKMMMSEMPSYVRVFPQTLARYSTRQATGKMAMMRHAAYRQADGQQQQMSKVSIALTQDMGRSTTRLAREVRHELLLLPYYGVFDWLEFEVRPDGNVTLRGQVVRPTTKSSAENVVKDIEGVTGVNNEIEVLSLSPNDDRLRRALYRSIYSGPLFRYAVGSLNTIHIIVNNGRAILKGWVSNEGDKTIAYVRARGVPGLFEVKNELRVEGSEPR